MEFKKFINDDEASKFVAEIIIKSINQNKNIVLGFATGSTPIKVYQELANDYSKNHTDWSNVTTFNLDEYIGIDQTDKQSYWTFMNKYLFSKVNVDSKNINFPSTKNQYDDLIKQKGGIDIQILGIGVNGHIGFNEPGSELDSKTRVVDLASETISINANKFFDGKINSVPKQAISMGINSILNAKKIILLAFGSSKSEAISKLKNSKFFDINFPASALVLHNDVLIVFDEKVNKKNCEN